VVPRSLSVALPCGPASDIMTSPIQLSQQILSAILQGPLFLSELPEAQVFDRSDLASPSSATILNTGQKLGHLYEEALASLLTACPRYDLLEKGLQLQRDKHQTVGELDFLFRDLQTGRLTHLELAVKFYLALETEEGLLLPGPNSRDNYFNKLDRLRSHQLTLVERFRDLLPSPYREEEIDTQHLVIGCLFDHLDSPTLAEPEFIHPEVRRGKWLHQHEFRDRYSEPAYIIPKPLWPCSIESSECLDPLDLSIPLTRCTMAHLDSFPHPFFIAPDEYPVQS